MQPLPVFKSAPTLLRLDEVRKASDETYVNSGLTMTFAIKDSAEATVTNGTGSLSYIAASNGRYEGTIPSNVGLTVGQSGAHIEITVTGTVSDFRRIPLDVIYHREQP